jgi:hypothetical protein
MSDTDSFQAPPVRRKKLARTPNHGATEPRPDEPLP